MINNYPNGWEIIGPLAHSTYDLKMNANYSELLPFAKC